MKITHFRWNVVGPWKRWMLGGLLAGGVVFGANRYEDDFQGGLGPGWSILREVPSGWRTTAKGLEVRMLPGNMWGPENSARNVFVRDAPDPARGPVTATVRVENRPDGQYEQINLVWYYADSHMVKIGQEQVDGQWTVVMGREEGDRTRTLAIVPITAEVVDLKLEVEGDEIRGMFRTPTMTEWKEAGRCDLPVMGPPKITLQAYHGPADGERWGRFSAFRLEQGPRSDSK